MERRFRARNVTTVQLQCEVLHNTTELYMKESTTHAVYATKTAKQFMKEGSIHAMNVTTWQVQRVISLNSIEQYMRERSTHVVVSLNS